MEAYNIFQNRLQINQNYLFVHESIKIMHFSANFPAQKRYKTIMGGN